MTILPRLVLGACLAAIVAACPATALQPEPQKGALPRDVLHSHLLELGYIGHFPHGQELKRAVSAFLWDHRAWLKETGFHPQRDTDVAICLLAEMGYPGFTTFLQKRPQNVNCTQVVRRP